MLSVYKWNARKIWANDNILKNRLEDIWQSIKKFVLDQLNVLENITAEPLMGEYLLYCDGALFGGIYDDTFLIKIVDSNKNIICKNLFFMKNLNNVLSFWYR